MLEVSLIPAFQDNYIFFLKDTGSGKTAVVDPGDANPVKASLAKNNLNLDYIFITHHHSDHAGGLQELKQKYGSICYGPSYDAARIPGLDVLLKEDDELDFGETRFSIWFTPAHTRGHICYVGVNEKVLFCGDTLFSLGCGRLFEGTAEQMWTNMLHFRSLAPETKVFCAHEYTESNLRFALTIDGQNDELKKRGKEIVALRQAGKATIPAILRDELAANPFMRCEEDSIAEALGMKGFKPVEVFAELRKRKDKF